MYWQKIYNVVLNINQGYCIFTSMKNKAEKTRSRCKKRRQNVKSNTPNLFDILNNEERQTGHTSNLFQKPENTKM